jgi:hypothetical protein
MGRASEVRGNRDMSSEKDRELPFVWIPIHAFDDERVLQLSGMEFRCLCGLFFLKALWRLPGMSDSDVAAQFRLPPETCARVKERLLAAGLIDEHWDVIAWGGWPKSAEEAEALNRWWKGSGAREDFNQG